MEKENQISREKSILYKTVSILAITGSLALFVSLIADIKSLRYVGAGINATNVISVTGKADKDVAPDIARITFTARATEKKVADAKTKIDTQAKEAVEALKNLGIAEKDIKTTSVSSYPKYNYPTVYCTASYCPPQKQVLEGYEYVITNEVKVRDTDKVGNVLEALTKLNINELYGPEFTVDDIEKVKDEVRGDAIKDAKEKAEVLAKDLGVELVRITSFTENAGGYQPIYMKAMSSSATDSVSGNVENGIMQGENKIETQVTITYEIK